MCQNRSGRIWHIKLIQVEVQSLFPVNNNIVFLISVVGGWKFTLYLCLIELVNGIDVIGNMLFAPCLVEM